MKRLIRRQKKRRKIYVPNRKLIAGPTWFAVYTTAVAVALCLSGNHATDNLLNKIG